MVESLLLPVSSEKKLSDVGRFKKVAGGRECLPVFGSVSTYGLSFFKFIFSYTLHFDPPPAPPSSSPLRFMFFLPLNPPKDKNQK